MPEKMFTALEKKLGWHMLNPRHFDDISAGLTEYFDRVS